MENKIRIFHIAAQINGGVYTYLKQIISTIDKDTFELEVIAPYDEEFEWICKQNNINYLIVDIQRGFSLYKDLKTLFFLYKFLKNKKPDLIHLHSAKAGFTGRIASKLVNIKSIYTPHGMSYLGFTGIKRLMFFALEVFAKRFTYNLLACSESEKIRCQYEVGIDSDKISVIPNAILVKPIEKKNNIKDYSKQLHIGLIARLTYQKNPVLFVEIAKVIYEKFPHSRFSILGAGIHDHLKEEVERLIGLYQLREVFKIYQWGSFVNSEEYFKTLDIFLMPSIFEGLPFSLLEAMNENVLCITSKCDGCSDVIENAINGFSCMTLKDYINAISRVIENPEESNNIIQQANIDIKNKYNLKASISLLEKHYLKLHLTKG